MNANWRYVVVGTLAAGFSVMDAVEGSVVSTHDLRVDANREAAQRNRADQKTCPDCGAPLDYHVGVIEKPVQRYMNVEARVKVLGGFYACTGCEFCIERAEFTAAPV